MSAPKHAPIETEPDLPYYAVSAVVWGDHDQLAALTAKPTTWFPSLRGYAPEWAAEGGHVFIETRAWSALPDWIERLSLKPEYNRLYWLVRWSCTMVGAGTYARRGAAADPWADGLARLTPLQHKLELLHLLLRAADGVARDEALRDIHRASRDLLAARPEWGDTGDEALARGCDLQAAV